MSLDDVLHDDGGMPPAAAQLAKARRGFATMHPDAQREIARKGGRTAHARGTAHEFDEHEARAAGKKGGKTHSVEHMRELGRRGGKKRGENIAARKVAEHGDGDAA